MLDRLRILVPVFLAAQAIAVHWASTLERPPDAPGLTRFPAQFDGWKLVREDPLDKAVVGAIHADDLVSRIYAHTGGQEAALFIAWFQTQRAGARQPHSPQVCLPASGWTPLASGEMTLDTAAGTIPVNRYVVTNQVDRAVVLYWYQTPHRAIAGEWAAKLWLV